MSRCRDTTPLSRRVYATNPDTDYVTVTLKTDPPGRDLPDGTVHWTGGSAGAGQFERRVSRATLREDGVRLEASVAGDNVFEGLAYVFRADPGAGQASASYVEEETDRAFTIQTPSETFGRAGLDCLTATDYDIYYKDKQWRFVFKSMAYRQIWAVRSQGRRDVTSEDAAVDPFPLGMDMPETSSSTVRRIQAWGDLSPDASGRVRRDSYWSYAITRRHEHFHMDDYHDNFLLPGLPQVKKQIEGGPSVEGVSVPVTLGTLNPDQVLNDLIRNALDRKVEDALQSATQNYRSGDAHETRAYGDGKASYIQLAGQILLGGGL